ncbi:hypothetical protein E1A91_D05G190800v1 [Gossypium mustelinum]|uniref:HMA domain-containing protein n=1 Tax=Gossypium mustelinum TaxID=34275 RepID=A0A5D2UX39_GOSMU|nr:hypothetical protein E1A91_D05G190800v1 [Gossypium mustelinum]
MADKHKMTIMVLTVDLRCRRCYLKVRKVLCEFPEIRDQTFDEKANTVTIIVVCCNPEKVRDKLRCKGGFSIESIEIKPPPKSPARRASSLPKPPEGPANLLPKPPETPVSSPLTAGTWAGFCCNACYHGQCGDPCYFGGPPPPPCYWTYCRPVYDRWGGGSYKYCYSSHGDCFIEQNPQACSIL